MKKTIVILIGLTFLLSCLSFCETLTLTTYYPSPHGSYKVLKTNYLKMGVHDTAHHYDYLRLLKADGDPANGANDYFGGFMWNDDGSSTPWGDGDDFTIFTYPNPTTDQGRDILLNPGSGQTANPGSVYLAGKGVGIAHTPDLLNGVENRLEVRGPTVIGVTYTSDGTEAPANGLLVEGVVGIGRRNPTQKLDVNGGIRIGNASNASGRAGAIRYRSTSKFQGHDGSSWKSLGSRLSITQGEVGRPIFNQQNNTLWNHVVNVPSGYTRNQCNLFVIMKAFGWAGQNKNSGFNINWRNRPGRANQWQINCKHRDNVGPLREGICGYQVICQ